MRTVGFKTEIQIVPYAAGCRTVEATNLKGELLRRDRRKNMAEYNNERIGF